jgi:hypothetical protein
LSFNGDAINDIINDQNQSSTTTSNSDENVNKSIDDKLKEMERAFQLKMDLMEQKYEGNNEALQKELAALKQKELGHQEENRLLKERLAIMEAGIQDSANNDLSYDSECSIDEEEVDDIIDKAKMNVTEGKNGSLQNDIITLKQENHHQYEENQLLKERLAGIQDDANDDPYYNSSDNDDNNDINYDSECSEQEDEGNNTTGTTQQHKNHSVEIYANPNYDSFDNEDSRNDIYLD